MNDIMIEGIIHNKKKYISVEKYKAYLIKCKETWKKDKIISENEKQIIDFLIYGLNIFMLGEKNEKN